MGAGDPAQLRPQPGFLIRTLPSSQPVGRAVLAGDPAGSALGHPEPVLQVPDGPAATVRGQKFPSANSLSMSMSKAWSATIFFSR
jgi:hypothetical protein